MLLFMKENLFTAGRRKLWTLSGTKFDLEPKNRLRKRDKLTYIFY